MRRKHPGWQLAVAVAVAFALAAGGGALAQQEGGVDVGGAVVPPGGGMALADVEWAGLVWSAGEAGFVAAPQLAAEVELSVRGLVARARVRQRFTNPSTEWAEGMYVFPLPETGAIDRLRMTIGDRVIEGQVREKAVARQEFEQARREGRRASLLEQHRPNVFTTRVTNVAPGETVEVTIELQQAVEVADGRMRLRFPTVVTPRYVPGGPVPPPETPADGSAPAPPAPEIEARRAAAGAGTGGAVPAVHRPPAAGGTGALAAAGALARAAQAIAGEARPALPPNHLSLAVDLEPGFVLAELASPSHAVAVAAAGSRGWRVELAGQALAVDRDFVLEWAPAPGRAPRAAVFTEEHEGDTYALLVLLPPPSEADGWAPLAREVVFVLDTSGSMHGAAIEQARAALGAALARLKPWDEFNVIEFDDRARPLFADSVPADPAAVERARAWVAGLEADGGTDMRGALELALAPQPGYRRRGPERVRQIVFLTDGAVGNEEELFAMISRGLGDARLFTVGIGSAPNGYFMRRAAEVGRGGFTWIGDLAEVGGAIDELAKKLEGPVLTDLEVTWDDPTAESWPERLPDLYAGEPLVVAARLIDPGEEVRVAGRRGGVWWEETVRLGTAGGAAAARVEVGPGVRQLWARRKIDHWLGRLVEGVPEDEVRREVVATALAHHLVSRYTSLVAVDVTPARPAGATLASGAVMATPDGQLPVGGTGAAWNLLVGLLLMFAAVPLLARRGGGRGGSAGTEAGRYATLSATAGDRR